MREYDIQHCENLEEEECTDKTNFCIAAQNRLKKSGLTSAEKIEFISVKFYVMVILNIFFILEMMEFDDEYNWLFQDKLSFKIVLYSCGLLPLMAFSDFAMKSLEKELPVYSVQERALLREPSVIRQLPIRLYIPTSILALAPVTFIILQAIFSNNNKLFFRITGMAWLDNLLAIPVIVPIYICFSLWGIRISSKIMLNYLIPSYHWVMRKLRPGVNILQASESLPQFLQSHLLQVINNALANYRIDDDRIQHYQKIFLIMQKLKKITDYRDPEVFEHLKLLILFVKAGKENHSFSSIRTKNSNYWYVFKNMFINALTFIQVGAFMLFVGVQRQPDFFEQNFLLFLNFQLDVPLPLYSYPVNMEALVLYGMICTILFNKTLSLLVNKLPSFLKCLFHGKSNVPIPIQQHSYGYALSSVIVTFIVVLGLPFNTFTLFPNWVLGEYDDTFTPTVSYAEEKSLLNFYTPAFFVFGYFAYQSWRLMVSALNYVIKKFFSTGQQFQEIELEQYIKTICRLVKSFKREAFLGFLESMTEDERLQLFDCKDFEKLLEIAYEQKGTLTIRDERYLQIKNDLLSQREKENQEEQEQLIEILSEDEKEVGITQKHNDLRETRLTSAEVSSLIRTMHTKANKLQKHILEKENEEEKPLIEKSSWFKCALY